MSVANQITYNGRLAAALTGSGIPNPYATITGVVAAGPTATAAQQHTVGTFALRCALNLAGGGLVAADLTYTCTVNGVTVLTQFVPAEAQASGATYSCDNLIFVPASVSDTEMPVVVNYGSAGGALNVGATGSLIFSLTRVC
jgi:hypothetical protein